MDIYKSAKKVVPKHQAETTNAEFIRIAPHGLYFLITEFRSYIEVCTDYDTLSPSTLDVRQISFLYQLHDDLRQFLNTRPLWGPKKNVITKALRTSVAQLKSTFIAHKSNAIFRTLPSVLSTTACQIINSTLEFVEAFVFLDGLIVNIKNCPTDWAIKRRIAVAIIRHQASTNKKSFPKFITVLRALNRHKHNRRYQLSLRNYGNLKKQWRRGTYWHFIQP
jgi:hypothetical protein